MLDVITHFFTPLKAEILKAPPVFALDIQQRPPAVFAAMKRSSRFPSKCDLLNHKCKVLELLILVSLNALLIMTDGKITRFG